jgi:ubiquinone/menaquinone biosynthesis C-methylase UbiE
MLKRVLEVEVMDSAEEAADYDQMDHSQVNRRFVDDFLEFAVRCGCTVGSVLDVGTGTALIPIELCRSHSDCQITAIDMSAEMLKLAAVNVQRAGFEERIELSCIDAKQLPFASAVFQSVISNSIIHHIPEPARCVAELVRLVQPGGLLFVRDLMRPESDEQVLELVQTYAGNESAHSRQMFDDSLRAALSLQEMQELVQQVGFERQTVVATSDRHWTWSAKIKCQPVL